MQRKYRERGLVVLTVATTARGDATEKAREYQVKHHVTLPVLVDAKNETVRLFGVKVRPSHVIIGRDGRVVYVGSGVRGEHLGTPRDKLPQAVEAAMSAP